jgi:hypothetical protein
MKIAGFDGLNGTRMKKKMPHQIFEHVRLETRTVKLFIKAFKLPHIKFKV